MKDGITFAEAVSKLTINDICKAVQRKDNGINDGYKSIASRFLNSVSTSCRPVGHSNEAAKYARRQFFLCGIDLDHLHYFSLLHQMMNVLLEFNFMLMVEKR